jgi:peptidoglycan hydrolase-like protein with peptidoglycan-binding domain
VDADNRRPGQLNPADAGKYKGVQPPATRTAAKSDPTVKALQDKLIAAGAKIKPDGVMGPATQAAMKQFPQASAPAAATRSAASGTVASAGGGRGFVNPTAANTAAAKPAAPAPAAPAKPAVKESQEINRMRFLAGLSKD